MAGNVKEIQVAFNGRFYPSPPFTPKMELEDSDLSREYISLINTLGIETGLSMDNFMNDTTIYTFQLDPNLLSSSYHQPREVGSTRLNVKFDKPLENSLNIYWMGIYDGEISINGQGIVHMDYLLGEA